MKERPHLIITILAVIMLFIAIAPMPQGYYDVLKWVIFLAAVHIETIVFPWKQRRRWLFAIIFGLIAILFRPILPPDLSKTIWIILDILCSATFIYSAYSIKKPQKGQYDWSLVLGTLLAGVIYTTIAYCGLVVLRRLLDVIIH